MRSIGIDLGEDSVKIVELVQNKKNIQVQSVFEKKLTPLTSTHDREIEAIEYVRDYVKALSSKTDLSTIHFVMAVSQNKATVRKKTFPFSDRLKIQKSLSFEMEEDIPFDPDNCIFDFKTLQYIGNSAQTLSIAVPKVHIQNIISLANDFGINLKTVTVEGFAFSNLIENWWQPPANLPDKSLSLEVSEPQIKHHAEIYLNIGHKKTLLCAKVQDRVVFIRSLMWGADSIIQEMMRRMQLPYIEAQRNLQNQASLLLSKENKSFDEVNSAILIESTIKDFVRDIQMSFLELESEYNVSISHVNFTGGLSGLPHLGAYLTQQLEVPCNPVNLIAEYIQTPVNTSLNEQALITKFATAIGIALESFKKPKNPAIQLLKGDFLNQNSYLKNFWLEWGKTLQVGVAGLIVLFAWGFFRESFSTNLNEKGSEAVSTQAKSVAKLPPKKANEKGVKKYIADHRKRVQEIKAIAQVSSMQSALDILKKVSESAPAKSMVNIDITHFSVNDDLVKLSGYANSPKEINLFSSQLANVAADRKVSEEPNQLSVMPNKVAFSLSFKTDRGITRGNIK